MRDGIDFESHAIGAVYHTLGRTVSETDIVSGGNPCSAAAPPPEP